MRSLPVWLLWSLCSGVMAQTYPAKPITLIVPFATGGSTDIVSRVIAQELTTSLGKQVLVDNRTGGSGVVGWNAAARAAPDGYTLLAQELSYAIAVGLLHTFTFDPHKGLTPITTAASVPHVMVVHPSVKANNVKELIALAKAAPGKLFFGSGGNGTNTHLGGELFKTLAGVDLVHVPYKGAGAVLQDLLGGQVQMLVSAVTTTLPHIKSGKLRALGVGGLTRNPVLPDIPTIAEAGVPTYESVNWWGLVAPAGTPPAIVEKLHREIAAVQDNPEVQQQFANEGASVVKMSTAEFAQHMVKEMNKWERVVKEGGIKAE
jgi:tripartite-type tricarboxylate transporter receptor subunit TctC